MIDVDGYRPNVGIILINQDGAVLWAKRVGQNAWQFPQGGIKAHESPKQAMFRELNEEIGLNAKHVRLLGVTRQWLRYRLPNNLIRYHQRPLCIGQKQLWYLLRFTGASHDIQLHSNPNLRPEFDRWQWVDYWFPLEEVIFFKRKVYEQALKELAPLSKRGQKTVFIHK